jgi:superfamily II DNA or RNA helicase
MAQLNVVPALSTDLTFLTNEPGNTLADRFQTLLTKDTRFFDCLVGYFFISGFYKLYPSLENVEKIRILVGLKTDRTAYELLERVREQTEFAFKSHAEAKREVAAEVLQELEKSHDSSEIEAGVHRFVEWVRLAIAKFNELWAVAVDVSKPYEETIVNRSPYAHFTPYELYLKFLYEYFKNELNRPSELEGSYVPEGFKKLKYQEEAVLNAQKVLDEYGGVFLSDVVGLGKTYMSALLAQQLEGRCLVIAPPHLLDKDKRGSWPNVFSDFQARQTDFESAGKLDDLVERDLSKYTNVFIDESHRFRTETNQTYEMLARICRGKRVILVSATPLNNTPRDILSQVKLFQNGKNSTIPNLRNLEGFFARFHKRFKGLDRQRDREEYFRIVQENAKATREQLLKYLMIRRTRTEIEKYYGDDMRAQGLSFPEVQDPQPLFYKFNKVEGEFFDESIRSLGVEFKYARYQPLEYYEGKREQREVQSQKNLAKFMKILMVKRLESSFQAFRLSLDRFIHSYDRMIAEFRKGTVYSSKKYINKIFDLLEQDDQAPIEDLLAEDKAERLSAKDFRPDFIMDLESDRKILHKVANHWDRLRRDPKWVAFRETFRSVPLLKKSKLIIFTESKETAEHLGDQIRKDVEPKVIVFTGQSDEATQRAVIANFDANAFQPRDDYRILVSTEVLSEGVNLHRSNVVINYDIPWNPTRLIQRVGRVNRVDTKFDTIYTYNFFPTDESEDLIKLKAAAEAKIHAFIEMLGADARLLTEGEVIKSHDLFAKLTSKKTITGEEEEESELEYLTEIRDVRDKNPDLFARIKRLPKKARSSRMLAAGLSEAVQQYPTLLTYFRQGPLDKFFAVHHDAAAAAELDFFAAANVLKPEDPSEKRQPIPQEFYALLDRNKGAFAAATSPEAADEVTRQAGGANDAYIAKRLRAREIRRYQGFTDDEEAYIQDVLQLLSDGALPRPTTKKVAEALRKEAEPLKVLGILRRDIPAQFLQPTRAQQMFRGLTSREVILSSWLLGGK